MQTYKEFRMQKYAKTPYEEYAAKRDAGDQAVNEALSTPTSQEFGWGLLGAGLGAGGGYLVSRWLRRNGTKKQRALDMLIGAILGGGGSYLLLNSGSDNNGFSAAQRLRIDELRRSRGEDTPADVDPTAKKDYGMLGGAYKALTTTLGGLFGYKTLPADTWLSNIRLKQLAKADNIPAGDFGKWRAYQGMDYGGKGVPGGQDYLRTDPTAKLLHGTGSAINTGIGAAGGYLVGNATADKVLGLLDPYVNEGRAG